MKEVLRLFQIVISLILIILVLMQSKGVGLGRAWGGGGEFYKSKRGVERVVFYLTIAISILFLISSLLNFVVS